MVPLTGLNSWKDIYLQVVLVIPVVIKRKVGTIQEKKKSKFFKRPVTPF